MKLYSLLVLASISACGSSGGGGSDSPATQASSTANSQPNRMDTLAIDNDSDLPKCDKDSEGRLVYVKGSKTFKACSGSNWASIDIQGAAGKDGSTGKDGANGKDGSNGSDNKITKSIFCQGQLGTVGGIDFSAIWTTYDVKILSSGDVFVHASVRDNLIQVANSQFYSKQQNGALTGAISILYDIYNTASVGNWTFSVSDTAETIVYTDSDLPTATTRTFTNNLSSCSVQSF